MKLKKVLQKMNFLPVAMGGLLFMGSCSSPEPVAIKKDTKFTFDGSEMTVNYKVSSVVMNEETRQVMIAPEGKAYMIVDVTAKASSYFLFVKDGETDMEEVDFLVSQPFVKDIDITSSPNKSDMFLVDLNNKNYKIEIKSFGDEIATLALGALKDEATITVSANMKAFVNDFAEGGRLIDVITKYVKAGTDVQSIVTDEDSEFAFNTIVQGLSVTNMLEDGTVIYSAEMGLQTMSVLWDGENITRVVYKM